MSRLRPQAGGSGAPQGRIAAMLAEAIRCHQDGRTAKAERLYRDILAVDPGNLDAVHLTGILAGQKQDYSRAIDFLGRAANLAPGVAQIHANLGKAYLAADRIDEARASLEEAVRIAPDLAEAWNSLGNAQRDLGALHQALESFARAMKIAPRSPEPWVNRADVLMDLGEQPQALASLDQAMALNPGLAEVHALRARLYLLQARPDLALAAADQALATRPAFGEALALRGNALTRLARASEAASAFAEARAADPQLIPRLMNKARIAGEQALRVTAVDYYERLLALDPEHLPAAAARAVELMLLKRLDEAAAAAARTLELDHDDGLGRYVEGQVATQTCDWDGQDRALDYLRGLIERRERSLALNTFAFMSLDTTPAEQLTCALICAGQVGSSVERPRPHSAAADGRIRVAYLSADYYGHATSWLLAGLVARHDRSRFEVIALSNTPVVKDDMRARLEQSFDRFVDIRELSDAAAHQVISDLGVDILIDLKGYTLGHRAALLARRPAPVQVSFLGYPGTMGANFIDYLIADACLIPPDEDQFYSEKVVRLPGSYQVTDDQRPIAERTPTRAEAGLPNTGFVFCSFNNSYKITRPVFDVWMRLLAQVPNSVLWLLGDNEWAIRRLREAAAARGVDPARLVFAERAAQADHLARQRLGDLFLDTTPVNAHTTASDALWAGLPVLTVRGKAFIGRVAESVLRADGLPELVTPDLAAYEAMALALARDPERLVALKAKVAANRGVEPLFDTDRFRRNLETAYEVMHARSQGGLEPQAFDVPESETERE